MLVPVYLVTLLCIIPFTSAAEFLFDVTHVINEDIMTIMMLNFVMRHLA
uniref:Uncharacterized protein n=1 Tax=Arundo donax TaxID=35708 RepID=A0A0A9G8X6_ARUDO